MAEIHFDPMDYLDDVDDRMIIEYLHDRNTGVSPEIIVRSEMEQIVQIIRSRDDERLREHMTELIYDKIGRIA